MAQRTRPDDFESPQPHTAPKKTVVDHVLNGVLTLGNSMVSLVSGLLAAVLVIYSGYVLYDSFSTEYKAYSSAWDLLKYKPEFIDDQEVPLGGAGASLADINQDYRAWLTVYDTSIDYPVMQGQDDLYYAWHDIYGNSSLTGAIYLAARNTPDCSDEYNLIYGHHMDNGAMFGRLDDFRVAAYYKAHPTAMLVTRSGAYDVEFFALVTTDAYENRIYTVGKKDSVMDFLKSGAKDGVGVGTTILQYDAALADSAEQVLALSTCASAETSGRLVLFGKMTKREAVKVQATGFHVTYDGQTHTIQASADREDAELTFSIDGGEWTTEWPEQLNRGEHQVRVRATTPSNGTAETTVTMAIDPRPVTITTGSASKPYDGTPLTSGEVSIEGLVKGESVTLAATGTITEVGTADNHYSVTWDKADKDNYIVTEKLGILTITGRTASVIFTAPSATRVYDGTPLTDTEVTVTGLPEGFTFRATAIGTQTDAGDSANVVSDDYQILDKDGKDVTAFFTDVQKVDGTLTVTRRPITVTDTLTVWYTGEEQQLTLEAGKATGVLQGETLTLRGAVIRGTDIGTYTRVADNYTWSVVKADGSDGKDNYTIEITGRLIINPYYIRIIKAWENDTPENRPSEVNMVLLAGAYSQTVTLTAASNWQSRIEIPYGTAYSWQEPDEPGYEQASSTTDANGVTTIVNRRREDEEDRSSHTLTIHYVSTEGETLADDYVAELTEGDAYSVTSPVIRGYTTTTRVVSGTMGEADIVVTVIYSSGNLITIDMYGTPLGLGTVYIHQGDCFE